MAARGSKARKKDKRRRHAKARKFARDKMPTFNSLPAQRGQVSQSRNS